MEQNEQPAEGQARPEIRTRPRRNSRRKVLTKGLGVAVATVGAGALLELSSGTASAESIKPGVFASNMAGTPAVKATGSIGADGVDATSDSGTGVSATSGSGTGLVATSSSGLAGHFVGNVSMDNDLNIAGALSSSSGTFTSTGTAGHFVGNVNMDNNLNVARTLSTGTLSSGAGALASSTAGTPAVKATGTNGADGVDASSDNGTGVHGFSTSGTGVFGDSSTSGTGVSGASTSGIGVNGTSTGGPGVVGTSTNKAGVIGTSTNNVGVVGTSTNNVGVEGTSTNSVGVEGTSTNSFGVEGTSNTSVGIGVHGINSFGGLAGLFDGNVQVNGNFSATGTKAFVQAHPTDPSREIVYVALEGGEARTYVCGSGQLQSGKAVLVLPEHFELVTADEGLTIQLTPRSEWLQLYVVELDTAQLVVREAQGKSGAFDYFICGVRKGYEQHEVLRMKR